MGEGVLEAVKLLLAEANTLFDDMRKKLSDYPGMRRMLYELLYEGQSFPYNTDEEIMDIARMFGYIKECDGKVMISNRIFETRLYNLFVSEERLYSAIYTEGAKDKNLFIRDGRLDMRQGLENHYIQNKTGGLRPGRLFCCGRSYFSLYSLRLSMTRRIVLSMLPCSSLR